MVSKDAESTVTDVYFEGSQRILLMYFKEYNATISWVYYAGFFHKTFTLVKFMQDGYPNNFQWKVWRTTVKSIDATTKEEDNSQLCFLGGWEVGSGRGSKDSPVYLKECIVIFGGNIIFINPAMGSETETLNCWVYFKSDIIPILL